MSPLVVAIIPALLAVSAASADSSVALYLDFAEQPSERAISEMKRQVESLLSPAAVHINWRLLDPQTNSNEPESFTDLYVVRFRGTCDVSSFHVLYSELGPYGETTVLGSTDTESDRLQPFGQLECDAIRRSIVRQLRTQGKPERESLFGRALGRVLAHELFHMVTGTTHHSRSGVFKARHSSAELIADNFAFQAEETALLRRYFHKK
jgi:hypothetical protein